MAVYADAAQQNLLLLADDAGDIVHDAKVIIAYDTQCDGILAAALACPACLDNTVAEPGPELRRVGAVLAVNLNAATAGYKAEYLIAVNRLAATGHLKVQPLQVLVNDEYV